jgi:manganese efflux pump family protein
LGDHLHDLLEITFMSAALGMDAFSLSIGIGMHGVTRRRAFQLCVSIGVFHVLMTLAGLITGSMLEGALGQIAQWFGALLLFGLGIHMAYNTLFQRQNIDHVGPTTLAVLLFSAGVSIDALSVGFSLGLRSTAFGYTSALAFGVAGSIMTGAGLMLGRRANALLGLYAELIGAFILIGYGIHFLFD